MYSQQQQPEPPREPRFHSYTELGFLGAFISGVLLIGSLTRIPVFQPFAWRLIGFGLAVSVAFLTFALLVGKVPKPVAFFAAACIVLIALLIIGALS